MKINKICKYCEKEYICYYEFSTYCSNECKFKDLKVDIQCDECGKIFSVLKSKLKYNKFNFCSMGCKNKSEKFKEYIGNQIKNSEKYKEAIKNPTRIYVKGIHNSPNTEFKKGWQNTEMGKETIKKRAKSLGKNISKPEKFMIELINKNKLPFNFVGDGQFMVDTKIPDFIYLEKGKKVIEVFSDYWHRNDIAKYWHQTEEGTKKYYQERGYNVLIIWEKEIKKNDKNELILKIKKFLDDTLEIENVPKQTYEEFNKFSEQYFNGEKGLLLKWCLEQALEYQAMKSTFFENMNFKLNNILEIVSQNEKQEKDKVIKTLSGRELKGGK